ncbi:MATE family efflux transporter [Tumebacillus sp. DT12]|uniref:MATE family efflux transporter n=1 Tax=Tumebacillus lacus TaxID=2995335 RepID=A0ABT3X2P4_9BACL|nr:MATE family efflux transporter [Tumebacillus lacus]MCX7571169.1 MATE family efflux transporter [Tumebacillus lacus]
MDKKLTLFALTWPIFVEISLRMLMGNADTLMLSGYSDHAVAAVGVANQLIGFAIVMLGFVALGAGIVGSQYLGAKEREKAAEVVVVSLAVNLIFGIVLAAVLYFLGPFLLSAMGLPDELMEPGRMFLAIVGGLLFFEAISVTAGTVVRSYGYTKDAMYVTMGVNVLNVVGNWFVLFGPFDLPVEGVAGVACSTVISRIVGAAVLMWILVRRVDMQLPWHLLTGYPKQVLKNILRIGVPAAGEVLSYNGSQIAVVTFVAMLGAEAITTKIYVQNIMMFIYLFSVAVGQATQILVGHQIGAGDKEAAYQTCMRSLKLSLVVSLLMALLFSLFRERLLSIFTDNPEIIALGGTLILLTILLEPGRTFNLVIISSLRAAGDAKFPVYMGILSMWGVSVSLCYILGIHFGLGLAGMWIAFACDEWLRGLLMLWRWRSRRWEKMGFVTKEPRSEAAQA